jgi:Tfp pilus assembly protein PilF
LSIPYWARPLIYPPNNLTQGLQQNVLMLQFAPDQSMAEAKFHLARFVRLVVGDANQAEKYRNQLQSEFPDWKSR